MKIKTVITYIEEVDPKHVDDLREAFEDETIREKGRIKTVNQIARDLGVMPDSVEIEFEIQEVESE